MSLVTSLIPGPVRRRIALTKAYKNVFNSPDGQIVLKDLVHHAGFLVAEPGSLEVVNFCLGSKSMVLRIIGHLEFDETRLMEMAAESLDEFEQQA